MKKLIVLLVCVISLQSCKVRGKGDITISNDEMLNGLKKEYCKNGNLNAVVMFKDNMKHGISKTYYCSTGQLHKNFEFHNDTIINHAYEYIENGRIKDYGFYDLNGNLRTSVSYDLVTGKRKVEGKLAYIGYSKNKDYLNINESTNLYVYSACLPNDTMRMDFYILDKNKTSKWESKITNYLIKVNEPPLIELEFETSGEKKMMFIISTTNTDYNLLKDTIRISANVL